MIRTVHEVMRDAAFAIGRAHASGGQSGADVYAYAATLAAHPSVVDAYWAGFIARARGQVRAMSTCPCENITPHPLRDHLRRALQPIG